MMKPYSLALLVLLIALIASSIMPAPAVADPYQAEGWPPVAQPGLVLPVAPAPDRVGNTPRVTSATTIGMTTAPSAANPLCRLGVGVVRRNINDYASNISTALQGLRAGWYETWAADGNPTHPNGMEMVQTINLHQWKWVNNQLAAYGANAPYAVPYSYWISPSLPQLATLAAAAPGSIWLVGNEIERRDWVSSLGSSTGQNEILPELYAQVYHDVYQVIKQADPTARVANGSVIAPTPLRLQYLSRVWNEYQRRYGTFMPVDVWNMHIYMAPEVRGGWGIDIPAGIDNVQTGMWVYAGDPNQADKQLLVNKDATQVPPLVMAFRNWMQAHGQQNKPLLITEFGVNMPDWTWPGQFTAQAVRDEYMIPGLNYLQTATDPTLGYPADENHLVQAVNWYSVDGDAGAWVNNEWHQFFNGNLLNSGLNIGPTFPPMARSELGDYWSNYVAPIPETTNLRALQVTSPAHFTSGGGGLVTARVTFVFSNSGNVNLAQPFVVSIYDKTNNQLLASGTMNGLPGCGRTAAFSFDWPNLAPGYHPLLAVVDSQGQIVETNEGDNQVSGGVLVATNRLLLPFTGR